MILKSSLYYIGLFFILGLLSTLVPSLASSTPFGFICLLLPPFIAGFIISWKDQLETTKTDRWLFSLVMSCVISCLLIALLMFALSTPAGKAAFEAYASGQAYSTSSLITIAVSFMFFVYLFSNRIGFGFGIMFGKAID